MVPLWGPNLILFLFYILPQVTFLTSKTYRVYRVFFARKCFIPRREIRSISSRGPIDTLSIYCLSERILHFQKSIGFLKIFEPRKCFIPRREMRSISSRGPIETLSIYCCLSKRILHFQKPIGFLKIFEPRKCFIVTGGRVDGWTVRKKVL